MLTFMYGRRAVSLPYCPCCRVVDMWAHVSVGTVRDLNSYGQASAPVPTRPLALPNRSDKNATRARSFSHPAPPLDPPALLLTRARCFVPKTSREIFRAPRTGSARLCIPDRFGVKMAGWGTSQMARCGPWGGGLERELSRDGSHYSISSGILPSLGARSNRRVKLRPFVVSPYDRRYRSAPTALPPSFPYRNHGWFDAVYPVVPCL
jgi:hypothetical protein